MPRLASFILMVAFAPSCIASEILYVVPDLYTPAAQVEKDAARANGLVREAKGAAEQGQSSRALQLATQALRQAPDNAAARHVLGYERQGDQWVTTYQKRQLERGDVWHPRFGWIAEEDVARYEAGERRDGRRWISAEQDAARHATIEDGWRVRTDHFQVVTNHSLEAGAALAAELEQLFQVWRQLFAGYYLGDSEVRDRFTGERDARTRSRPMNVIYHRTKDEYVDALRHKQPRVGQTLGIYFDDLREAHFFATDDGDDALRRATLYHEAVHQLFQETRRARRNVGAERGFWLVEGVALYFESLLPAPDRRGVFVIGHPQAGRLPAARHRLLESGFYVPYEELAALGKLDLQRRADIAPLYSQAAGLATYLMEGEEGRFREPLVSHLRAFYEDDAREGDLLKRLGLTAQELDAGYHRYMRSLSP